MSQAPLKMMPCKPHLLSVWATMCRVIQDVMLGIRQELRSSETEKLCLGILRFISYVQAASHAEQVPVSAIGVGLRIGSARVMWQMQAQQIHPRYAASNRAQTIFHKLQNIIRAIS